MCRLLSIVLRADGQVGKPLSSDYVVAALNNKLSAKRIAQLAQESHVDFHVTPELEKQFRSLGATEDVLKALRDNYAGAATALPESKPVTPEEQAAKIIYPVPKLPMAPAPVGPPDLKLPQMQLAQLGDPTGTGRGTYDVGGNVTAPVQIYAPEPAYSEKARKKKYSGVVGLLVTIDAQGNVDDVQVIKPLGLGLDEKAIEAVRKWKFKPAMRNGVPVRVRVIIDITFRLL